MLTNYSMVVPALLFLAVFVQASPFPQPTPVSGRADSPSIYQRTVQPVFPDSPASCGICQQSYSSIDNCAEAAPVLANFSMIILNPSAFINIIQCSCTETFQSVFPQCVDCFEQTNQTDVLAAPNLPSVLQGMRNICALESTLLGGAASAASELPSSATTSATPTPTTTSNSQPRDKAVSFTAVYLVSLLLAIAWTSHLL